MNIQKQIAYKKMPGISYKKIDLLINEIIYGKQVNKDPESNPKDFNKWIMPEEPKGYIHCKKNDPL